MEQKTQTTANLLGWFQPDRTPFHLIAIAGIFTLSMLAEFNIPEERWDTIYWIVAFVIFLSIVLTLIPQEIKDEDYDKQLRFARSLGIASATLCYIFAESALKTDLYDRIVWTSGIQIFVFTLYILISVFQKQNVKVGQPARKKINSLQLCMITTSLLIGIVLNTNRSVKHHEDKEYKNFNTEINALKEEVEVLNQNETTIDLGQITARLTEIDRKYPDIQPITEKARYSSMNLLLLAAWIACIIAWVYQLVGLFEIKINTEKSID